MKGVVTLTREGERERESEKGREKEEVANHVIEHNRLPMVQAMEEGGEKKAERENLDKQAKGKAERCILCNVSTYMCSRTQI